jgi:cytochrome o ubiquinol oxidase subunit 2
MHSFVIPALSGQIYAMPGMTTQLNIEANKLGSFYGSSANISGAGFAGMHFQTISMTLTSFNNWLAMVQHSSQSLSTLNFIKLAKPSQYNPVAYYNHPVKGLFTAIVNQYMIPGATITKGVKG